MKLVGLCVCLNPDVALRLFPRAAQLRRPYCDTETIFSNRDIHLRASQPILSGSDTCYKRAD